MTVLPIVERELRVAARGRRTYWLRMAVALGAVFIGACIFVLTLGLPSELTGRHIFGWLSGLLLLYCLAYGRRSTADCLSQEKREGTLGLLFLTNLKGHDVVLGKLAATSLRGFYGLLAVFPVLAIPLLMGGITNSEFWRMALVLVDAFLFSLAIGILGSALSREHRRAMAANLTLLLLFLAVPPACAAAIAYFSPAHPWVRELFFSCPVYPFYLCAAAHYKLAPTHFWWSLGVIHGSSWLMVGLASWVAPHAWQDQPSRARRSGWRELWHTWSYGQAGKQKGFRKRLLDVNAFYWLAGRARLKPIHVWTFLGFMAGWWLIGWITAGDVWFDPSIPVLTALLLNCTLKVWIAIEAGQQLAEAQRTGAFELLLSGPLNVRDILRGQLLALRRQFLKPLLAIIAVELLFMRALHRRSQDSEVLVTWLAGMVMLVADIAALSWVAMASALTAKSHNHATIATVVRVLILPWVLFGVGVGIGNVWSALSLGKEWSPGWKVYLVLWFGLGLSADLVFGLSAWWRLRTRFRQIALRKFNPAQGRLAEWFRRLDTTTIARPKSLLSPALSSRGGEGEDPARCVESGAISDRDAAPPSPPEERAGERRPFARAVVVLSRGTPQLEVPAPREVSGPRRWSFALRFIRRPAVLFSFAALTACLGFVWLRARATLAPAVVVRINQSNGPLRVFPGTSGVLLILPDGSLWRWGMPGGTGPSRAPMPKQVGTNYDWVQAVASYNHAVGLRSDGTIWEWGSSFGRWPAGTESGTSTQVDPGHDWIGIAAAGAHSVALRRDGTLWAWGDNSMGQLGNGPGPAQTNLVQVGTNQDWAAVCCAWYSTLGLRTDGTLWTWGPVYVARGGVFTVTSLPLPTKVCVETNWAEFTGGIDNLVRTCSGEVWQPFMAPPNPDAPASSTCRLVLSNSLPGRVATAYCGTSKLYEVRGDGTLWERTYPFGPWSAEPVSEWRRVGRRSDWVSLWSAGGTAFGLTSDSTVWTWGVDQGRDPVPNFLSRLKALQVRLGGWLGMSAAPMRTTAAPASPRYQKQPRPLLRLVSTNSSSGIQATANDRK